MATILLTEASCLRPVGRKGLVIAPLPRIARWLRTARVRWQHSFTWVSSSTGTRDRKSTRLNSNHRNRDHVLIP